MLFEFEFWQRYLDVTKAEGAEYFGRNFAALWDAVDGGGPGYPGECELRFVNTSFIRSWRNGDFYDQLEDIASRSTDIKIHVE